jgi:DNA helicase-2/ATP-dependent DNA helicase PcrA
MAAEVEIEITDQDIDEIESYFRKYFDCSFAEKNTRDALKCVNLRDIQAGPGSGKTTVLVAKLAILSNKRLWRDTGICVLSHTNVARKEVETLLASHPTAYRLLSYPHYVGTIQSFVDRFLALPYLRNKGIEVYAIDNERFAKRARGIIHKYPQANSWLKMRHQRDYEDYLESLRYEGFRLKLGSSIGQLGVSEGTNTYKQLCDLKKLVSEGEGIFRFDDMYAFAEAYMGECPLIIKTLRMRFPWVFIDEMQDTNALQERILEKLFGEGCVLQRFGDVNQSIYSGDSQEESQKSFPKDDAIDLPESKRFGKEIAAFATNLTSSKKQIIKGNFAKPGKRIAFIFDHESIKYVLKEFGDFVLRENGGQVPANFVVKAVGFRKTGQNVKPEKIPFNISDYWSEFKPQFAPKSGSLNSLICYVARARCLREETGELRETYSTVLTGILRFLHIQGARNSEGLKFNDGRLMRELEIQQDKERFQKLIADMCLSRQPLDQEHWTNVKDTLCDVTKKWCGNELSREAKGFLEWDEEASNPPGGKPGSATQRINVLNHKGLEIEVGTIHSVKGQTHSATLVLETYLNKKHDLKQLLPYIKGESDASETLIDAEVKEHMKRIFVGGTRPREILGIAMHRDHLTTGDLEKLQSIGWEIKDLTINEGT